MTDEPQLFEWDLPRKRSKPKPPAPTEVERDPEWHLVVNQHRRTQYWHKIKIDLPLGGVVTECGLVGRIVSDECAKMTPCPDCSDT